MIDILIILTNSNVSDDFRISLTIVEANEDGTFTYVFIGDPVAPDADYLGSFLVLPYFR